MNNVLWTSIFNQFSVLTLLLLLVEGILQQLISIFKSVYFTVHILFTPSALFNTAINTSISGQECELDKWRLCFKGLLKGCSPIFTWGVHGTVSSSGIRVTSSFSILQKSVIIDFIVSQIGPPATAKAQMDRSVTPSNKP